MMKSIIKFEFTHFIRFNQMKRQKLWFVCLAMRHGWRELFGVKLHSQSAHNELVCIQFSNRFTYKYFIQTKPHLNLVDSQFSPLSLSHLLSAVFLFVFKKNFNFKLNVKCRKGHKIPIYCINHCEQRWLARAIVA